jgi:hypothetical protein
MIRGLDLPALVLPRLRERLSQRRNLRRPQSKKLIKIV